MQFRLHTGYGRAQAYAHSAQGAELVRLLEECELNIREQTAELLDEPIHEIYGNLQCLLEELEDENRSRAMFKFKKRLSVNDRATLNRILLVQRRKKQKEIQNEILMLQDMLTKIKETFGMP